MPVSYRLVIIIGSLIGLGLLVVAGCQSGNHDRPANKIKVVVSILPQIELVERIGGESVSVRALVGPGQSPATYDPTPKEMTFLAEAEIYFRVGLGFESIRFDHLKGSIPALLMVDTHEGIKRRAIESHHDDEETCETLADPHIWLSPDLLKIQAGVICGELSELRPEKAEQFDTNLAKLSAELDSLKSAIGELLNPYKGDTVYVFHPSFGYFTDEFSLTQVAIEAGGHEPGGAYLGELVSRLRNRGVQSIYVQPQFDTHLPQSIADEVNAHLITVDPLASDNITNLLRIGDIMARELSQRSSESSSKE